MALVGRLDRRVEIQERAVTRDVFGGESVEWVNLAHVWAGYQQTAAGEDFENDSNRIKATRRARFRIRYRDDVDETMRLVFDHRAWDIQGIQAWGRDDVLEIFCEATIDGERHTFTNVTIIGGLSADAIPVASELTLEPHGDELTFAPFTDMHVLLGRPTTEADITAVVFNDDITRENQVSGWTKFATAVDLAGVDYSVWVSDQLLTFADEKTLAVQ